MADHPDDYANRYALPGLLKHAREQAGISRPQLAAHLGLTVKGIESIEIPRPSDPPNQLVNIIRRHIRGINQLAGLNLTVIAELENIDDTITDPDDVVTAAVLRRLSQGDTYDADRAFETLLMLRLRAARRRKDPGGLNAARELGISKSGLHHNERCARPLRYSTAQRHARICDGTCRIVIN